MSCWFLFRLIFSFLTFSGSENINGCYCELILEQEEYQIICFPLLLALREEDFVSVAPIAPEVKCSLRLFALNQSC